MQATNALILIAILLVVALCIYVINHYNKYTLPQSGPSASAGGVEKFAAGDYAVTSFQTYTDTGGDHTQSGQAEANPEWNAHNTAVPGNMSPNAVTNTLDTSIGPDYPDSPFVPKVLPSRPCNIYYVPESYRDSTGNANLDMTTACDVPYFNKFKKPQDVIQNDLNKVRAKVTSSGIGSLTATEASIFKYGQAVIDLQNDANSDLNRVGKKYCKFDALGQSGWKELIQDAYGNLYPKKNLSNPLFNAAGTPESSSYCFKQIQPTDNPNENINNSAKNIASQVSNCLDTDPMAPNCAIKATSVALPNPPNIPESPFNDQNKYARIAFKTLNLNEGTSLSGAAFSSVFGTNTADPTAAGKLNPCKLGIPLPAGIPNYYFKFTVNSGNRVTSFRLMQYGAGMIFSYPRNAAPPNVAIDNGSEALTVYKELFTTMIYGNSLYIIPDTFSAAIYKFSYEACDAANGIGQISYDPASGLISGLSMSLRTNFNISAYKLMTFDTRLDPKYYGNLDALLANRDIVKTTIAAQTPPTNLGLPAGTQTVKIDFTQFKQGVASTTYSIPYQPDLGNIGGDKNVIAQSKQKMDNVFNLTSTTVTRTQAPFLDGRGSPSGPRYYGAGQPVQFGMKFTGYINIPSDGDYSFMVNSDDAADLQLTDIVRKTGSGTVDIPITPAVSADYYGYHWLGWQGNDSQKYTFKAGDYVKFVARFVQWYGDVGIQIYWLTPEQRAKTAGQCGAPPPNPLSANLPRVPADKTCWQEMPSNVFQFDPNDKDTSQVVKTLNNQYSLLDYTINTAQSAYDTYVKNTINSLVGKPLNFTGLSDIMSAKSDDDAIYVYVGEFENGSVSTITDPKGGASAMPTDMAIDMQINELDISSINSMKLDSPYFYPKAPDGSIMPVSYTVSFGINIEKTCGDWRNIIFHGADDNWSAYPDGVDRTPGIWIYPNSTRLHIRHHSTNNANDGIDATSFDLPLGNYAHVTCVVDANTMRIYFNGALAQTYNANGTFVWNMLNKSFFIHLNYWRCVNGYVKIKQLKWYNTVLGDDAVMTLFKGTGISAVPPTPPYFMMQDVQTGNYVAFSNNYFILTGSKSAAASFVIYNNPGVLNSSYGYVGIQNTAAGGGNNGYVRHAGYTLWSHGFANYNYDFAWAFIPVRGQTDVYTIANTFAGSVGSPNFWLSYGGDSVLRITGNDTQWRILGNTSLIIPTKIPYVPGTVPPNPTWTAVWSNIAGQTTDIGESQTNILFAKSLILKRECIDCDGDHTNIYYKRLSALPGNFSIYNNLVNVWASANNLINVDFKMYGSLDDLMNDRNAWSFCNYDDFNGKPGGFRDCGRYGFVPTQWSSKINGGTRHVKYSIMNPPL